MGQLANARVVARAGRSFAANAHVFAERADRYDATRASWRVGNRRSTVKKVKYVLAMFEWVAYSTVRSETFNL